MEFPYAPPRHLAHLDRTAVRSQIGWGIDEDGSVGIQHIISSNPFAGKSQTWGIATIDDNGDVGIMTKGPGNAKFKEELPEELITKIQHFYEKEGLNVRNITEVDPVGDKTAEIDQGLALCPDCHSSEVYIVPDGPMGQSDWFDCENCGYHGKRDELEDGEEDPDPDRNQRDEDEEDVHEHMPEDYNDDWKDYVSNKLAAGGFSTQGAVAAPGNGVPAQGVAVLPSMAPAEVDKLVGGLMTVQPPHEKQHEFVDLMNRGQGTSFPPNDSPYLNRGGSVFERYFIESTTKEADDGRPPAGPAGIPGTGTGDSRNFQQDAGFIIVADHTTTDDMWLFASPKCRGVIATVGGSLSHAVVVARPMGIPVITDVPSDLLNRIQPGDHISMDPTTGKIDVNGGDSEFEVGEKMVAKNETVRFVWSQGNLAYSPVTTELTEDLAGLPFDHQAQQDRSHQSMLEWLDDQGLLDWDDQSIGLVYDNKEAQYLEPISDEGALLNSLKSTLPGLVNTLVYKPVKGGIYGPSGDMPVASKVAEIHDEAPECPNCGSHTYDVINFPQNSGDDGELQCLTCGNVYKQPLIMNPKNSDYQGEEPTATYPSDPDKQAQVIELMHQIAQASQQGNQTEVQRLQAEMEKLLGGNPSLAPVPETEQNSDGRVAAYHYIRKEGDQWCIWQKSTGKTLSCHASEEKAQAAFRAMETNMHGGKVADWRQDYVKQLEAEAQQAIASGDYQKATQSLEMASRYKEDLLNSRIYPGDERLYPEDLLNSRIYPGDDRLYPNHSKLVHHSAPMPFNPPGEPQYPFNKSPEAKAAWLASEATHALSDGKWSLDQVKMFLNAMSGGNPHEVDQAIATAQGRIQVGDAAHGEGSPNEQIGLANPGQNSAPKYRPGYEPQYTDIPKGLAEQIPGYGQVPVEHGYTSPDENRGQPIEDQFRGFSDEIERRRQAPQKHNDPKWSKLVHADIPRLPVGDPGANYGPAKNELLDNWPGGRPEPGMIGPGQEAHEQATLQAQVVTRAKAYFEAWSATRPDADPAELWNKALEQAQKAQPEPFGQSTKDTPIGIYSAEEEKVGPVEPNKDAPGSALKPGTRVEITHKDKAGQKGTIVEYHGTDGAFEDDAYDIVLDSGERIKGVRDSDLKKIKRSSFDLITGNYPYTFKVSDVEWLSPEDFDERYPDAGLTLLNDPKMQEMVFDEALSYFKQNPGATKWEVSKHIAQLSPQLDNNLPRVIALVGKAFEAFSAGQNSSGDTLEDMGLSPDHQDYLRDASVNVLADFPFSEEDTGLRKYPLPTHTPYYNNEMGTDIQTEQMLFQQMIAAPTIEEASYYAMRLNHVTAEPIDTFLDRWRQVHSSEIGINDSNGAPLQIGKLYLMHSTQYKVPDLVRIVAVDPNRIEAHIDSDVNGMFPIDISKESFSDEGYSFEPYEPKTALVDENMNALYEQVLGALHGQESTPEAQKVAQDLLNRFGPTDRVLRLIPDADALSNFVTYGDKYMEGYESKVSARKINVTPKRQKELISENMGATARNFDKLNLEGTHYDIRIHDHADGYSYSLDDFFI